MIPGSRTRRIPRQARSRQMVARLLEAAASLFAEQGYAASTTNHIAERAGVSVGSLYQFFPDKAALLTALQARWTERLGQALDEVLRHASGRPLADVIDDVLEVHARLNSDPPGLLSLLLSAPSTTPDTETVLAALQRRVEGILEVRAPQLGPEARACVARLSIHIAGGLYALGDPAGATNPAVRAEVRAALLAYLSPIVSGHRG
ncbi:TetR/AcrR family transcriptional regulator [Deinococcus metallilatus]|nr:TetR/AcrR family transcriptional regulator [Deinococcus metallilatus]MBB5297375.1 AcrR family transcriptional regulator [Deinococcus metallilatus]GMA17080.1 TetR family transcriptional regulator [Deinococcus metallilatus]